MFTVLSVRDPRWGNPQHTRIDLFVVFVESQVSLGEVPFTASPDDVEEHGRLLFLSAKNGEYGPVAEYAAPVPTTDSVKAQVADLSAEASQRITLLQDEVSNLQFAVDSGEALPEEEARLPIAKKELYDWNSYRLLLSRVVKQAGFPLNVKWPVKPA